MALGDFFTRQLPWLLFGSEDVLRNRRHQPRLALDLPVQVEVDGLEERAQVRDFGRDGLRLSMATRMPRGRRLSVRVLPGASSDGTDFSASAPLVCRVAWCRYVSPGFQVGCKYESGPETLATSWVQMLLVDRLGGERSAERRDRRVEATIPATLSQAGQPARDVFVLDLSLGGARVFTSEPWLPAPEPHPRLQLTPPGGGKGIDFSVEVVESAPADGSGFSHRLRFRDSEGRRANQLRRMLMGLLDGVRKTGRRRPADVIPEPSPAARGGSLAGAAGKLGEAVREPLPELRPDDPPAPRRRSQYLQAPELPERPADGSDSDVTEPPPPRRRTPTSPLPPPPGGEEPAAAQPAPAAAAAPAVLVSSRRRSLPPPPGGSGPLRLEPLPRQEEPPVRPPAPPAPAVAAAVGQSGLWTRDPAQRRRGWLAASLSGWFPSREFVADLCPLPTTAGLRVLPAMSFGALGWAALAPWAIETDLDLGFELGFGLLYTDRRALVRWFDRRRGLSSWMEGVLRTREKLDRRPANLRGRACVLLSLLGCGGSNGVRSLLMSAQLAVGIARHAGIDDPARHNHLRLAALLKDLGEALLFIGSQPRPVRDLFSLHLNSSEHGELDLGELSGDWSGFRCSSELLTERLRADAIVLEMLPAHAWLGAGLLLRLGFAPELAAAVRCHHEHWDGSGHPLGLKGEQIPWEARCLALADGFTADYLRTESAPAAWDTVSAALGSVYEPRLGDALRAYLAEVGAL